MQVAIAEYWLTVGAVAAFGLMLCVQLLVADLAGIKAGHKPGLPVDPDHSSFLFRASRVHANTIESAAAFIALTLAGILLSADPAWLNGLSTVFLVARVAHMVFYYLGVGLLRSIAFAVGLIALFGISATDLLAYFV